MFWLILAGCIFIASITVAVLANDGDFVPIGFGLSIVFIFMGVATSLNYDVKEVIYQYEELMDSNFTKRYSDNEIIYTLGDGSHKIANLQNIKIKKMDGDIYVKYTETKCYNTSFFKYTIVGNTITNLEFEMR